MRVEIERPTWTRLGDSGDSTPALDTADQCEMFVVWTLAADAENSVRASAFDRALEWAPELVWCALVDRSSGSLMGWVNRSRIATDKDALEVGACSQTR